VHCADAAEPDLPRAAEADAAGRLALAIPDDLDAGCWNAVLARGCAQRSIPLHALRPEVEPGRFAAWFDLGPVRTRRSATYAAEEGGLRVLDVTPLNALGGTFVRFSAEGAADPGRLAEALERLGARPELRQRALLYRGKSVEDSAGWGARRIGAARLGAPARPADVRVALIDTAAEGIADEHARDFTGFEPAAGLHATALAGIVAEIAPRAKLRSFAACRDEPGGTAARCWSTPLVRALDAALAARVRIALLGFHGPEDPSVARALDRAAKSGMLLIAPADDSGDERPPGFPASHPAVLGVTAVDREGDVFAPAARGEAIDLAAPGVDLPTRIPGSPAMQPLSGNALAAATAAGAAALLLERWPRATNAALRETLARSAVDLGAAGRDPVYGDGLIDVCAAARALAGDKGGDPCPELP
jgi:subtilisin family serine protease